MKSYKDYKKQAVEDWEKAEKVILSCRSKAQIISADKYFKLWIKKYNWELYKMNSNAFMYREGYLWGLLNGIFQVTSYYENK